MRPAPQALLDRLLPALSIAVPAQGVAWAPRDLFAHPPQQIWLEVGFGSGEHLAWQAARHPDIGMIGAEVFLNGIAGLLGHIESRGLTNIRIFAEDVRVLLPHLPVGCLSRVFVLFPDPWPKTRHEERRFIADRNLDLLAPLMQGGALLRIASDDATYQNWVRGVMAGRDDFRDVTSDPAQKSEDWPTTRYETKARLAGRAPIFLSFEKCGL